MASVVSTMLRMAFAAGRASIHLPSASPTWPTLRMAGVQTAVISVCSAPGFQPSETVESMFWNSVSVVSVWVIFAAPRLQVRVAVCPTRSLLSRRHTYV